jgi:hypothetical protein
LLEKLSQGVDISNYTDLSKVKAWKQTLLRKGYISEKNTITEQGLELLKIISEDKPVLISKAVEKIVDKKEDDFERWWKEFPANDIFVHQGVKFNGSRSLRSDKPKCKIYFSRILAEGEYTCDDLIRALRYEVKLKKELSLKSKENKLSYLSASSAYLNQRKFEAFIEISKNDLGLSDNNDTSSQKSDMYSGYDI